MMGGHAGRSGNSHPVPVLLRRLLASLAAVVVLAALLLSPSSPARAQPPELAIIFATVKQDGGYNAMAASAVATAERNLGVRVRQRIAATGPEVEEAVSLFVSRGVGHVVLVGASYAPMVEALADRYPDVRFTLLDGIVDRPNVGSIVFREEEGGYLAGIVAASFAPTGQIGFLGGMPVEPVKRFGCGFIQGARMVRPDATLSARYVAPWVEGFRDTALARSAARALVEDGAEVVFVASGLAGLAALDEVVAAGRYAVGVDTNQNGHHPGRILTSVVKHTDVALERALTDAYTGRWIPGVTTIGLREQGLGWAVDEHNRSLVAGVADQVEDARRRIAEGSLAVDGTLAAPGCEPLAGEPRPPG